MPHPSSRVDPSESSRVIELSSSSHELTDRWRNPANPISMPIGNSRAEACCSVAHSWPDSRCSHGNSSTCRCSPLAVPASTRKANLNSLLGLRRLLALQNQLAQRCNIGSSGGDERIGVGGTPSNGTALLLEPHGNLGLRVRALRHGVNLIEIEASVVRRQQLDRVEGCIDRPVSDA